MAKISINLKWSLNDGELSPGKYSNKHQIEFNDEIIINFNIFICFYRLCPRE